jgi:hypothetical protein
VPRATRARILERLDEQASPQNPLQPAGRQPDRQPAQPAAPDAGQQGGGGAPQGGRPPAPVHRPPTKGA